MKLKIEAERLIQLSEHIRMVDGFRQRSYLLDDEEGYTRWHNVYQGMLKCVDILGIEDKVLES